MLVKGYWIGKFAYLVGAYLVGADLRGANLSNATLRDADLRGADLRGATLRGANLSDADLRGANLRGANLSNADLWGANLRDADLSNADLRGANLSNATLRGATLKGTVGLEWFRITPDGAFLAYKKLASGEIAVVNVPYEALRVNAYGSRKIRVSMLRVEQITGKPNSGERTGPYHPGLIYELGAVLSCEDFDPDPRVECSRGLHVFLTHAEAETWP
jgi:hypothetical protein